jgi:glutamyl-tRNA reductase
MGVLTVGLSHRTAPLELREKLAIPAERLADAIRRLNEGGGIKEAVLLSTCNRLEVYVRPEADLAAGQRALERFFTDIYNHPSLAPSLYRFEAGDAVHHLFRVAAGLDSMVVGETEILGQVRSAYTFAQERGVTGKITNVMFQRALYVGKKVRNKTRISEGASSVGAIAVQLAEKIFGRLNRHRILLLGAGKMAEVTARHLLSQKATEIMVLNRTESRAVELARLLNGQSGPIETLPAELLKADIVICSTSSDRPLVTREMMAPLMKGRRGRSLYFIDIAVPRNVEPSVHGLDNAYVYNIDDLQTIVQENMERRQIAVASAEDMVKALAGEFYAWLSAVLEGRQAALKHGEKFGRRAENP